jgi:spermidine synthase
MPKPASAARTQAAPQRSLRLACYLLFTASGFAGLIYESVWSHYLKLVLGHAAYAQTLVLALFMGGMAAGSWLASRWSRGQHNPLRAYAMVEGIIALCAFAFHPVFELSTHWLVESWIVQLRDPFAITLSKWGLCTVLILPEALLLGMTFPLMSVGVMRLVPAESGATLATLYFTNSLGAVIGVLASGFVLIPALGLPGTVMCAGVANALVGLAMFALSRDEAQAVSPSLQPSAAASAPPPSAEALFLCAALLTGLASFFYEIAWIRMLSMVLGSTVQAFELMLGAFIVGLAFGSLAVRRRIDRVREPARLSGYVQIAMGVLALCTLIFYASTFDAMAYLLKVLPKTDQGYSLFHAGSALLALAIMLPTTLVAGTTLPLFTHVLLCSGHGERSVGRVYAANTLGAIVGTLLAVHLVLPQLGVRGVIGVGAAVDVLLGLVLLLTATARPQRSRLAVLAAAVGGVFVLVLTTTQLDATRTAAGVFRTGQVQVADDTAVLFHRDGKTATIDVTRSKEGVVQIATNGKPDAAANSSSKYGTPDEVTMVAAAAFALAHAPAVRRVANIGFGSGMTTHTLLGADRVAQLDTIEIEPVMVEGARAFGALSQRAYTDPRSHIFIEDAKTFLSTQHEPYDVIVSEPSNPWVSGVASLFSREFYRDVKRHLRPGGLLVQWSQLYETDLDNLASLFKALGEHFDDYVVYATNDLDMLIVATPEGAVGPLDPWVFAQPALAADMARVGIRHLGDIQARRYGDRNSLEPLFLASSAPANSDFFPFLSYRAPRTRYLAKRVELSHLLRAGSPVPELLDGQPRATLEPWTETPYFITPGLQLLARWAHGVITGAPLPDPMPRVPPSLTTAVQTLLDPRVCGAPLQHEPQLHAAMFLLAGLSSSVLPKASASEIWQRLRSSPCFEQHSAVFRAWFALYAANAARDGAGMQLSAASALQQSGRNLPREQLEFALTAGTLGALQAKGAEAALAFYAQAHGDYEIDEQTSLALRLAVSNAAARAGRLGN